MKIGGGIGSLWVNRWGYDLVPIVERSSLEVKKASFSDCAEMFESDLMLVFAFLDSLMISLNDMDGVGDFGSNNCFANHYGEQLNAGIHLFLFFFSDSEEYQSSGRILGCP